MIFVMRNSGPNDETQPHSEHSAFLEYNDIAKGVTNENRWEQFRDMSNYKFGMHFYLATFVDKKLRCLNRRFWDPSYDKRCFFSDDHKYVVMTPSSQDSNLKLHLLDCSVEDFFLS